MTFYVGEIMARVLLENVFKVYPGSITAVQGMNLEVNNREFMVLVGPSGCGKSTTLRMVAGLEDVTRGNIYIDGRRVNNVSPKDRDIAMVFQSFALYQHMTVYKNMDFGLRMRGFPKAEIEKRVAEAAEILGLEHVLNRKPKALSGGQRQRVAVGRAIVRKPKVFLFDEPLSNLDAKKRIQMRTELSKLHTRLAATMIYVTHDQNEAMTMGDRICVMKDGVVQQVDRPLEVYYHPTNQFVAGFIGSPPMNFFDGTIERKAGGLFFNEGSFNVRVDDSHAKYLDKYEGKTVVFGVRPEDLNDATLIIPADPDRTLIAKIEVYEPVGADVYLYLHTGQHSFIARMDSKQTARVGQDLNVIVDMKQVHFFHKETGVTIV